MNEQPKPTVIAFSSQKALEIDLMNELRDVINSPKYDHMTTAKVMGVLEMTKLHYWQCDVCDLQAEVERLNRVNADLVDALINLRWAASERDKTNRIRQFDEFMDKADAALAKATGETK